MVYGFWLHTEDNARVCLALPRDYGDWIQNYNYPTGITKIPTLNSEVFEVKVLNIAEKWFFYDGWRTMINECMYPSGCNFIFQYEESLLSFRMISFHQDAISAPENFFYCSLKDPYTTDKRLHISPFVGHGLLNRQLPENPIDVRSVPRAHFEIEIAYEDGAFYVTGDNVTWINTFSGDTFSGNRGIRHRQKLARPLAATVTAKGLVAANSIPLTATGVATKGPVPCSVSFLWITNRCKKFS